jgi:CO dehydrogenase/acetyl-CoA synthase gamma subunit (corrinoid Fe-S protein)
LPKLDCGICGAPTCLTFAEDIVKGEAVLTDCIFNLPHKFADLSQELSELLSKFASLQPIRPNISKTLNNKDKK